MKRPVILVLVLAGLLLSVSGCGKDNPTVPNATTDQTLIAADPFDNVLKSTDGSTPTDPQERCDRLAEILDLSDQQWADLSEAYLGFRNGMHDLRAQVQAGEMTIDGARMAAAGMREAFEAEIQVILTEEQWNMLQEMRHDGEPDDGHHHHMDRDRDWDGDHDSDYDDEWGAWMEDFGLSEDQMAAVIDAFATMRTGMQDVRDQVQAGDMTMDEAFEAAAALRDDFEAALQEILTEEQYQAFLEWRPDCGGRDGR